MPTIAPWTATVTLYWRPTPRAYDARISLLNSFEDQKRLRAFEIHEQDGHALIDEGTEIAIGIDYFSVSFAEGLPDGAQLPSLVDSVLSAVNPRPSGLAARFQHLHHLAPSGDQEQVKATATRSFLGSLTADLRTSDAAILVDGSARDGAATYQAEFGIVDRSEAAARLTQTMGRMTNSAEPNFTHVKWDAKNLPEISLYVDSRWRHKGSALSSLTGDWLHDRVKQYCGEADRLVESLLHQLESVEISGR